MRKSTADNVEIDNSLLKVGYCVSTHVVLHYGSTNKSMIKFFRKISRTYFQRVKLENILSMPLAKLC